MYFIYLQPFCPLPNLAAPFVFFRLSFHSPHSMVIYTHYGFNQKA